MDFWLTVGFIVLGLLLVAIGYVIGWEKANKRIVDGNIFVNEEGEIYLGLYEKERLNKLYLTFEVVRTSQEKQSL